MTPVLASVSETLFNAAWHFVRDGGLPAVFLLMVADSACIPIPSEATMMFAGFAASSQASSHAHHHLTLFGVVVAGVLGNLVGSWIAYGVGRGGRIELVERHGHWLHITPSHLAWADRWFARYGSLAILLGRVLPLVRTFISLPAGVARMPFWRFTVLTIVGCIPWVLGLALAGNAIGSNWATVRNGFSYVDYIVVALFVVWVAWMIVRRMRRGGGAGPTADVRTSTPPLGGETTPVASREPR